MRAGFDPSTFSRPAPSVPQFAPQSQRLGFSNPSHSSKNGAAHVPSPAVLDYSWQAANMPMVHELRTSSPNTLPTETKRLAEQRHGMTHNLDMGPERLGLDFLLDGTQRINKVPAGINGMDGAQDSMSSSHPLQSQPNGYGAGQRRSNSIASYNSGNQGLELTGHAVPIRNSPPTCPLDSLLLDFLHERQQQAAEGVSTPKLVGPAYPSVSSLLNPSRAKNSHPLSKVFTDILATFPDLSTLPEKVAVLYIMFLIMRWQIAPTQENYDRLPDWVTPRAPQLFTPHPAWFDHLPWPKMRDRLVRDFSSQESPVFDNFFIPFTTTLSLNWPYEATDTLLSSPESEELMINPVFERHLRRLENWTLGPAFAKTFPSLTDTYNLKTEPDRRV
jgi:hypothetical protein